MYPDETAIFLAILTAAMILLILVVYFIMSIAAYQNNKRRMANRQICADMLLLEKEQTRIALDLHDDIGNSLSAIRLQLEVLKGNNEKELETIARQVGMLVETVRQISFNLLPETLNKEGICAALKRLTIGLPVRVYLSCEITTFAKEKELQVFRIVQEMLGNTLKHAGATEITIMLKRTNGLITLRFRDNGRGFDPEQAFKGTSGLQNIHARAALLNAEVFLVAQPGGGVSWQLEIRG